MAATESPSLAAKASSFEYNLEERHCLDGLCVSLVRIESGEPPEKIVAQRGLRQIDDEATLQGLVEKALQEHPQEVERYRAGKTQLLGFFVGQVMRATRGQAHPGELERLLRVALDDAP